VELLEHRNLPRRWAARWAERPHAEQLRGPQGGWLTGAELEERSRRAASRLAGAGLTPGARLLIDAESSIEFVVSYVAALRAGLTVVPLNPSYPEPEVRAVVTESAPAAAIAASDERARWIGDAGAISEVFSPDLGQLRDGPECALDFADTDATALLVYTSGTTGRPKGVPLSHGNLLASATAVGLAWRWEPADRLLLTLPLFHVHGLGVGINGALCAGAAIELRPRFDPDDVAARATGGATMFFGVPAMYERLARGGQAAALKALRLTVSGSAPLPAELAQVIARDAGQVPLERYGMTETLMLAGNPYEPDARRPGTVGFPLPGVELRLADTGEVQVRGPNVIAGYLDRPQETAEAFTADGWFRTGDLGELDGDGYLRLVGRSKELIITGGYNVYPREVEEALATHPSVREVAVVGRPSERWGEEVVAVVVAETPVAEEVLRGHVAKRLAPYKVPKRVEFADQLPRNALGKVVRGEL